MATLEEEVAQLRQLVKDYEQREIDRLQANLQTALVERDHYKSEAYRNADIGRQISTESQKIIDDLKSQLTSIQIRETNERRSSIRSR